MVNSVDELGKCTDPSDDEKPFFCLLEDDSLISNLSVETDTLLQPTGEAYNANDARLVLTIKTRILMPTNFNSAFA